MNPLKRRAEIFRWMFADGGMPSVEGVARAFPEYAKHLPGDLWVMVEVGLLTAHDELYSVSEAADKAMARCIRSSARCLVEAAFLRYAEPGADEPTADAIPLAPPPAGITALERRAELLRQVLDEDGSDVLSRGTEDERALIEAGFVKVRPMHFDDGITRQCLIATDRLEGAEDTAEELAAFTLTIDGVDAQLEASETAPPADPEPPKAEQPEGLTPTQDLLLRRIWLYERGFPLDTFPAIVQQVVVRQPSDSVLQCFRGALGVLLERGLVRKVETKTGAIILPKDAPDPCACDEAVNEGCPVHGKDRPGQTVVTIMSTEEAVLEDLRAHPRSTAAEIAGRTRLALKDVQRALKGLSVEGEGHGRGKRYWLKDEP